MKIKTIRSSDPATFDEAINKYLENGWKLMQLNTVKHGNYTTFVAFLHLSE